MIPKNIVIGPFYFSLIILGVKVDEKGVRAPGTMILRNLSGETITSPLTSRSGKKTVSFYAWGKRIAENMKGVDLGGTTPPGRGSGEGTPRGS